MISLWASSRRLNLALGFALATTVPAATAGDFTFGGKLFADVSQLQQHDRVAHTDSRTTDADLKRLYLDADYAFDPTWSAHLTTDIQWLRGHRDPDVWAKRAYLQRKFGKATVLRVGVDSMPMSALTSKWYGYRYIDSVATSRDKIDTAADWGVHLKGVLAPRLDYAVSVVSGGGYKHPTHGRRADVEAMLAWHTSAHTVLALGGYDGQLAAGNNPRAPYHTARRLDLLAAYAGDIWRVGTRYSYASNWNSLYSVNSERSRSWSVWSSVQVAAQWSVFARYDHGQPTSLSDSTRHTSYADAGLQWQPVKRLRLALVTKRNAVRREGNELRSGNETGIWSELTF